MARAGRSWCSNENSRVGKPSSQTRAQVHRHCARSPMKMTALKWRRAFLRSSSLQASDTPSLGVAVDRTLQ